MINWGNVPLNSVIPFPFDAFDGGTGASITLTGLVVGDIEIYKGTSMTQRASDSGVVLMDTDGIDLDLTTGIHGFSIDTSDNADAGFYAAGSFYWVVVASVTIDAQTVNFVAGTFRLVSAEGVAGVPDVNTTHISDTAQTANDVGDDANTILTRLGTPAGASVSADIAAIEAQTDDIGVAGAGLTAVPWNAAWDAEVESEVDDALGAGTGTALTAIPWNASWDAEVESEVNDAIDTAVTQPGQATPASNPSLRTAIAYLFKAWRNRFTQTATQYSLYNDDAITVDQKSTVSDDATTFDRTEVATGP